MSHYPSQYTISVVLAADLSAYPATFNDGDTAYVSSLQTLFVYDSASTATLVDGNVIDGPSGQGRWIAESFASAVYGDGSDGVVTFDGTAYGAFTSYDAGSKTYKLARDVFLRGGSSIAATYHVDGNGFRLFCNGTFTIAAGASLHRNGNAGADGTTQAAGVALASGSLLGSGAGGAGSNAGAAAGNGASGGSVQGGGGDGGNPLASRGTGGAVTIALANYGGYRFLNPILSGQLEGISAGSAFRQAIGGGSGGGGGGGNLGGGNGGGGGSGGGVLGLYALNLINAGTISATGGAGGAGTGADGGGGGGGGGGNILMLYRVKTNTGTIAAAGGVGGAGSGTGTSGQDGQAGAIYELTA